MDKAWRRYIQLLVLALGGTAIYFLPYLRWTYYDPLKEALGLTNTDFGMLMTAYGLSSMVCYFPGGWLADRFSTRKLLSFSLAATGVGGLYFATYPPFNNLLIVNIFWGTVATLSFWAALIKATRALGGANEQGKFFGLLEGSRGLLQTVISSVILAVFVNLGANIYGLTVAIKLYSWLNIATAALAWFMLQDNEQDKTEGALIGDVIKVVKMPETWLISLAIFGNFTLFTGSTYLTPYLTKVLGLSVSVSGMLALIRIYGLQMLGGPLGGYIADKVGSPAKVVAVLFGVGTLCMGIFAVSPNNSALLWILAVNMIVMGLSLFIIRGVYFAILEEVKVPVSLTGAVAGFASMIGFTPDIFVNPLGGYFLDQYPGIQGYHYFFGIMTMVGAIGTIAAFKLLYRVEKVRKIDNKSNL